MGHVIMEPVSFITSHTHFILKASTCEKIEEIRVVHAFDESMGDYISQNKRSTTRARSYSESVRGYMRCYWTMISYLWAWNNLIITGDWGNTAQVKHSDEVTFVIMGTINMWYSTYFYLSVLTLMKCVDELLCTILLILHEVQDPLSCIAFLSFRS